MLQDAIFARRDWLGAPGNEDIAIAFLRATFRGWIFAREHQTYQLHEVNPLVWPVPAGIGITAGASWD